MEAVSAFTPSPPFSPVLPKSQLGRRNAHSASVLLPPGGKQFNFTPISFYAANCFGEIKGEKYTLQLH